MSQAQEYLTQEKFDELKKELEYLKTGKRKEVAENLEYAKGLGDLSENAEYHEAREMQATVEDRIAKLENILKSAVILRDTHSDTVSMGSVAVVERSLDKNRVTFTLVGSEEVDAAAGKISIHSPIGSALMGKRKGDKVAVKLPSGETTYSIVEVK